MANMHLVTGYAGQEHVTAADQGAFNAAVIGGGEYVMGTGNQFAASIISNNQIRVLDGDVCLQGRFARLNKGAYVDLAIENGAQGLFRNDLIAVRYTKNQSTAIEEANIVVIKGEPVTSNPVDPTYTNGDVLGEGDTLHDMPLYRVVIDGLNLVKLVPLYSVYMEAEETVEDSEYIHVFDSDYKKHKKVLWSRIKGLLGNVFAEKSHNHKADDITSGVLPVSRGGTGAETIDAFANANSITRIKAGSYVGTGTYGKNNPNKITFSFNPRIVIVLDVTCDSGSAKNNLIMVNPAQYSSMSGDDARDNVHITWGTNSVSWYLNNSGVSDSVNTSMQANTSGATYHYVVVY